MTDSQDDQVREARAQYQEADRKFRQAQRDYRQAKETLAAAERERVRTEEAVNETKAAIAVLEARKARAEAAADDANRHVAAIGRIRSALPALHKLWERYPDLPPEEKFAAAGMTLTDVGLLDGDLQILASIPSRTT
ncbi:hypothetical protein ACIQWZ_38030 [Streptomyces sp. NPDC098077]|uniref:hypothetical protein n=1 Tax=Streptomyces sp. NPDC098077 TaxID=3366093 RepID=UPI0038028546